MDLLIKGGTVVDPANQRESKLDVLIQNKKIAQVAPQIQETGHVKVVDANGKMVLPGLVDMHAHLRQPGRDDEETILTGSEAAVKGGYTTVLCMPNTDPVIDHASVARWITEESQKCGLCQVIPVGCVTKGQAGIEISEFDDLKQAGCLAVSDDGKAVKNAQVMRRAMEYAGMVGLLMISHSEDTDLSGTGQMNESLRSTVLGLKGIPEIAETIGVAREIELARFTKTRVHLAHISCERSVALVRQAKKDGIAVTAETCPHYFTLTEDDLSDFDTNKKINPPLRSVSDRQALCRALADGSIDIIATDHAPHALFEKELEFNVSPCGTVGLETALSLAVSRLVNAGILGWPALVRLMSLEPARILGLDRGTLSEGRDADVVIVDPQGIWDVTTSSLVSKSKNSAFLGFTLQGRVDCTIFRGKIVYHRNGRD